MLIHDYIVPREVGSEVVTLASPTTQRPGFWVDVGDGSQGIQNEKNVLVLGTLLCTDVDRNHNLDHVQSPFLRTKAYWFRDVNVRSLVADQVFLPTNRSSCRGRPRVRGVGRDRRALCASVVRNG